MQKQNIEYSIYNWVFHIPLTDVRNENHHTAWGCFLCGKEMKNETHFVHYLTNGNLVSSDQNFEGSQGFFPIGKECMQRLPNNFVFQKTF